VYHRPRPDRDSAAGRRVTAIQTRRIWAAAIDLWAVPLVGSVLVQLLTAPDPAEWTAAARWTGAILFWLVPLVGEALTGRTLGKAARGLHVVAVGTQDRATPRQAVLRRTWALPFLLQPAFPPLYGVALLAVVATVVVTMIGDLDARGWPDRIAGTDVVPAGAWVDQV
jgi:hypothetical protein